MSRPDFTDPGVVDTTIDLGDGLELLVYDGDRYAIAHDCGPLRVAPWLTDHEVREGPEGVTVTPSILCDSCGLHGFVVASQWADA